MAGHLSNFNYKYELLQLCHGLIIVHYEFFSPQNHFYCLEFVLFFGVFNFLLSAVNTVSVIDLCNVL